MDDVKLIKAIVGDKLGIKAAGGIRDFQTARALVIAGATRLGCSASVAMVTEHTWFENKAIKNGVTIRTTS